MKRILIVLFIAIVLISCKDEKRIIKDSLIESIHEDSFKKNLKADILKFEVLNIETVNENSIDTLRLMNLASKYDVLKSEYDEIKAEFDDAVNDVMQAAIFGKENNPLLDLANNKYEKLNKQAKEKLNDLKQNIKQDSIISATIKNRTEFTDYKKVKVYYKIVLKDNKDKTKNLSDTVFYIVDKNNKLLSI